MIGDFLRAVGQLGDPRFRRVFLLSLGLTVVMLAAAMFGWGQLIAMIPDNGLTAFGQDLSFLDWAVDILAWTAGALGAVFLMFPVAALFIGLFLEEIAEAVEAKFYPDLPPARSMTWLEILADGLIFTAALIGLNLVGLVIYFAVPPAAPFVFVIINGWLLGRQYFELAAARRIGAKQARVLRKRMGGRIFAAGVLMALALSIPLVALAIPVLAVATFTHMFHRSRGEIPAG